QAGRDLGPAWPVVMRATRAYADQVLPGAPPATEAIGTDGTRRGRPVRKQNDDGKWELVADPWHIGFVDTVGGPGLSGQVGGRNAAAVAAWLAAQPAWWTASVRYAAIGLCATFRSAVRTALPHATVVVDAFHIVQVRREALVRREAR